MGIPAAGPFGTAEGGPNRGRSHSGNSSGNCGQYRDVGSALPSDRTDAALIRISLDEPPAFGAIFDRHAPAVHRYLVSRVKAGVADDLLSEVFVTAFRRRSSYDTAYAEALPWLLGIASNVIRHHHRSERRRMAMVRRLHRGPSDRQDQHVEDVATEVIVRDQSESTEAALANVDERYRDALILFSAFDLSYADIARVLDLRIGTVRSRISRGRAQLRELLAASGQYLADEGQKRDAHMPAEEQR